MQRVLARVWQLTAALALLSFAQAAATTEHDVGTWLVLSMTDQLPTSSGSSRWRYWFDSQARFSDIGSGSNQFTLRAGIGYELKPNLTAFAGYARFRAHRPSDLTVTEDRLWQQLTWRLRDGEESSLSLRVRAEQRSLSIGSDTGYTARAQLRYVRQISSSRKMNFITSLESFFQLRDTDWGANSGLSRMRGYAGVAFGLSDKSSFEAGYQNQHIFTENGEDRMRHIVMFYYKTKF